MPSKKRGGAQPTAINYRKWRSQLKAAGLFGKRTNLSKRVTPAQKRQITKYKDVVTGKAKAFDVDKKDAAKMRRIYGLKGRENIVVVPKAKGEKLTFNKKRGEIKIKKGDRTRIIESEFKPGVEIPGKKLFYSIEFARGGETEKYTFEDFDELKSFMTQYETPKEKGGRGWKNWRQYVQREYLDGEELSEIREEGGHVKRRRQSRKSNKSRNAKGRKKRL